MVSSGRARRGKAREALADALCTAVFPKLAFFTALFRALLLSVAGRMPCVQQRWEIADQME